MNPTAQQSNPRSWLPYWIAIVLGTTAAAYVSYGHYVVLRNSLYFPWCDISARVACTPAYVSRFGYVFGLPVGPLLLTSFLVSAFVIAWGPPREHPFSSAAVFVISIANVAVGMYQTFGTAVLLHLVCIPCVVLHGVSLALFAVASNDAKMPAKEFLALAWRHGRSGARPFIGGATVGALLCGIVIFFPEARPTTGLSAAASDGRDRVVSREALTRWYLSQSRSQEARLVASDAVVLVKFNDFQCPPCRQAFFDYQPALAQLRARFGPTFKFTNIDFPLDKKCNPFVSTSMHPVACEAAVAVRLAARAGKAASIEEWLFTHQTTLSAPSIVWSGLEEVTQVREGSTQYAENVGALDEDIQFAHRLGIDSTPTFFLDGVRLGSGMSPAELVVLVETAAARAGVHAKPTN